MPANELPGGSDVSAGLSPRDRYVEIWFRMVIVGFVVAVAYHWVQGYVFCNRYPSNTFLFRPFDRFADFYNVVRYSLIAYTQAYFRWEHLPYPPAMLIFASWFQPLGSELGRNIFLAGFLAVFIWFCWPLFKTSRPSKTLLNALVITGMSYPVLFVLDRGNFETYAFAAVAVFLFFFEKKRYWLAAPFLGLAIAFKIFPVVFIPLYFARRRILEAFAVVGYAGLFTLLALFCFEGSVLDNIHGWIGNMRMFNTAFAGNWEGWPFSCSVCSAVRTIAALGNRRQILGPNVTTLMAWTAYACAALGLMIGGYVVFFQKTLWKQVLLLVICLAFLPQVSGDYRLLYVFLPMVFLVKDAGRSRYEVAIVILLGLLLIPKAYGLLFDWRVWVGSQQLQFEVTPGVILNPLIGMTLAILVFLSGSDKKETSVTEGFEVIPLGAVSAAPAGQGQAAESKPRRSPGKASRKRGR